MMKNTTYSPIVIINKFTAVYIKIYRDLNIIVIIYNVLV